MDRENLERYRRKLLEARAEVIDRVRKAEDYGRELDPKSEAMDLVDQASAAYSKEFFFSLSHADRKLLQMIDEALRRIDDGTYGFCQRTGDPIEPKRLEAVPWARLCIRAQEMEERRRA
jgi:DnaK suppressor protein